jgi:hypothetical protein
LVKEVAMRSGIMTTIATLGLVLAFAAGAAAQKRK